MSLDQLQTLVLDALEEIKAVEPVVLDVRGKTGITDLMVVVSGTSNRHVKAIADTVVEHVKQQGLRPMGVEGEEAADWILVDLGDAVVHVMLPRVRELYRLERIWGVDAMPDSGEERA
ncbi:MAG: ribosome silencing factor [Ectothiorhodospiraceae bacterium]|nr:ribosome silencing factor [Ectothiorhodospiraceae bacterium]